MDNKKDFFFTLHDLIKKAELDLKDILLVRHTRKDALRSWHINEGYIREYTALQDVSFPKVKYIMTFISSDGSSARLDNFFEVKNSEVLSKDEVTNFFSQDYVDKLNKKEANYLQQRENSLCMNLDPLDTFAGYYNQLVIEWSGGAINWFQYAKNDKNIVAMYPKQIKPFIGFDNLLLSYYELHEIINNETLYGDWHTALKTNYAVYLITDKKTGKLYVGSATSKEGGLYNRWRNYSDNGHGENIDLKELSFEYIKENFQYSVLEVFSIRVSPDTILKREIWWKEIFCSKKFGYNKN